MLTAIPFLSPPIGAKRNSSKSELTAPSDRWRIRRRSYSKSACADSAAIWR
jgi:hypothetical protein